MRIAALVMLVALASATACGARPAPSPAAAARPASGAKPPSAKGGFVQEGMASWYGPGFAGKLTANGERFDPGAMTCAHRKLRFGTRVRVTNLENGKSVVVRVNDRGPYAKGRVIDVSQEAARRLGFLEKGVTRVKVEEVAPSVAVE